MTLLNNCWIGAKQQSLTHSIEHHNSILTYDSDGYRDPGLWTEPPREILQGETKLLGSPGTGCDLSQIEVQ